MIPQEIFDKGERTDPMNIRVVAIDEQGIVRDLKFHLTSFVDASGETPCIVVDEVEELKAGYDQVCKDRDKLNDECYNKHLPLIAENAELKKAILEIWYYNAPHSTMPRCFFCGEVIDEQNGNHPEPSDCIVLTCQPKED